MSTTRLCIFARVPVPGRVKRRLAAALGRDAALAAHDTLVRDTLARLATVPGLDSELWLDAEPNPAAVDWLRAYPIALRQQCGSDLGARMQQALEASLRSHEAALIVGADCPPVDAAYVSAAAARLRTHDLVVGPAEDGGYALIGARRVACGDLSQVFADIDWGTDRVLAATVERLRRSALTFSLLDDVWDVDDAGGWARFLALRASAS